MDDLKEQGLLVKVEPHSHNVGTHDRRGTTVEPMMKQQWFVKMDELIKPAVEGSEEWRHPVAAEAHGEDLFQLDGQYPRLVYLQTALVGDTASRLTTVRTAARWLWQRVRRRSARNAGCTHMEQDPDTLDTWFSSALWPFSTLGWPENRGSGLLLSDRCAGNRLRHHFLLGHPYDLLGLRADGKKHRSTRYCSTDWCAIPRDAR